MQIRFVLRKSSQESSFSVRARLHAGVGLGFHITFVLAAYQSTFHFQTCDVTESWSNSHTHTFQEKKQ